jgi:hypothetical protein
MINSAPTVPHFLGQTQAFEHAPKDGMKIARDLGLIKLAENRYVCPSTKDLWRIEGEKLVRLSSSEVDNGESMPAADANEPEAFLASLLQDLEF